MMSKTTYGAFARRTEGEPSFDVKNVHGGGHFGVGGVLGAIGDAYNSPGGELPLYLAIYILIVELFY